MHAYTHTYIIHTYIHTYITAYIHLKYYLVSLEVTGWAVLIMYAVNLLNCFYLSKCFDWQYKTHLCIIHSKPTRFFPIAFSQHSRLWLSFSVTHSPHVLTHSPYNLYNEEPQLHFCSDPLTYWKAMFQGRELNYELPSVVTMVVSGGGGHDHQYSSLVGRSMPIQRLYHLTQDFKVGPIRDVATDPLVPHIC